MHIGQHHQSLRRRGLISTAVHSRIVTSSIDTLAYISSFLGLAFTTDQIRIIWVNHNATGVSLLSWIFYTISTFVWLVYGMVHKDRVIVVTNLIWVFFSLAILAGIVLYS